MSKKEKIKLSFTQIDKILNMPRQWWYSYYLGHWMPLNDLYCAQGNGLHAVCEESLDKEINEKNFKRIYEKAFWNDYWKIKHLKGKKNPETGKDLFDMRYKEGLQMCLNIIPFLKMIKGGQAEISFEIDYNDQIQLIGHIDRFIDKGLNIDKKMLIDANEAGNTVIDWKTANSKNKSKHQSKKSLQLLIYAYYWFINYLTIPEICYIITCRDKKEVVSNKYKPTLKDFKEMKEKIDLAIKTITKMIQDGEAPLCQKNVGVGLCSSKWCDYWEYCQNGKKFDKPDKINKKWDILK